MAIAAEARDLAMVQEIFARHLPSGARVWTSGSRAREERVWRGSDLDVIFDAGAPVNELLIDRVTEDFSGSVVPHRVDLHDLHRTSPGFLERIAPDMVLLPVAETQPAAD